MRGRETSRTSNKHGNEAPRVADRRGHVCNQNTNLYMAVSNPIQNRAPTLPAEDKLLAASLTSMDIDGSISELANDISVVMRKRAENGYSMKVKTWQVYSHNCVV